MVEVSSLAQNLWHGLGILPGPELEARHRRPHWHLGCGKQNRSQAFGDSTQAFHSARMAVLVMEPVFCNVANPVC